MPDIGGFPPPRGGQFATTRWSLVLAAGRAANPRSAEALTFLCELYWHPVYTLIRRQGFSAPDGADLTQAFFERVLEKGYFQDADPNRGRFRAFLCTAVRHFLSNERDREQSLKRGGKRPPLSLDAETAEGRYQIDPRDDLTPEKLFDRQWALTLLERVLTRVGSDYSASGRTALFNALKGFLTGDTSGTPYAAIARDLGTSEGAIKVAIHRLRRQFRDALVAEIAATVSDPSEIDAELGYLLNAVSV